MDAETLRRLAILESRMGGIDRRLDDFEVRLVAGEANARFAAMGAQRYDVFVGIPTFGPNLYEIGTWGCFGGASGLGSIPSIPDVRITGDLWWIDTGAGTATVEGDAFDIRSDASGVARFYGRETYTKGGVTRTVGAPIVSNRGAYYRVRAYRPGSESWWETQSDLYDLITTGAYQFSAPQKMLNTSASQLYTCVWGRHPYPIKNYFSTNGGSFSLFRVSAAFGNLSGTLATNYAGPTWSWNGFAWMGNLAGTFTVTWTLSGGSTGNPTLQGWVWRVNPGGGDRPVDIGSAIGGVPARTQLFSAVTSPSSTTGDGTSPNWVGSYTYDFTGTTFGNTTGITTVTVTSA